MLKSLDRRLAEMERVIGVPDAPALLPDLVDDDQALAWAWEGLRDLSPAGRWHYRGDRRLYPSSHCDADPRLIDQVNSLLAEHDIWLLRVRAEELRDVIAGIEAGALVCRVSTCWVSHQVYVHELGNVHGTDTTDALRFTNATLADLWDLEWHHIWQALYAQCGLKWFRVDELPPELRGVVRPATAAEVIALLRTWSKGLADCEDMLE